MAKYKCGICGYVYDEEKSGAFETLKECPLCTSAPEVFEGLEETEGGDEPAVEGSQGELFQVKAQDSIGSSTKYRCGICGYVHDEGSHGSFSLIQECPVCTNPAEVFEKEDIGSAEDYNGSDATAPKEKSDSLEYPSDIKRTDPLLPHMEDIHKMAVNGGTDIEAMATRLPMPGWEDILILGAQLSPMPLNEHEHVNLETVIGRNAAKPMVLQGPAFVSHMSFGALSAETKEALAAGAALAGTATSSGEGGILPAERHAAHKYIFEYVPNLYCVNDENLRAADAIEIKIGQGTKPGMGGHLPGNKVTDEIAAVRGKPVGKDIISLSKFPGINTPQDMKNLVSELRSRSGGRPVGIKIAAGRLEKDLEICVLAQADFVTIDGRGGATGASPKVIRDSTSVPTVFALYRARKYLDEVLSSMDLIITGGLRISSDVAKAIAMGATAVAMATAPMMAAACQQYRICGSGNCPAGVATQDPKLRERFEKEFATRRVGNFFETLFCELATFGRITGNVDIHNLSVEDLVTINREISEHTNIPHA